MGTASRKQRVVWSVFYMSCPMGFVVYRWLGTFFSLIAVNRTAEMVRLQ